MLEVKNRMWLAIHFGIFLVGCECLPHPRREVTLPGISLPLNLQSLIAMHIHGPVEKWYVTRNYGFPDSHSDWIEVTYSDQHCVIVVRGKRYLVSSETKCVCALQESMLPSLPFLETHNPESVIAASRKIFRLRCGTSGEVLVARNKTSFDLGWAKGKPSMLKKLEYFCQDPTITAPDQTGVFYLKFYSMTLKGGIEQWTVQFNMQANNQPVIERIHSKSVMADGAFFPQWG